MPYFRNNDVNLLFIHVPKSGGTSLERYFSSKFNIPLNEKSLYMFLDEETALKNNIIINSSLQHMTHQTICKYKTEFDIDFNNIKIITIVRNPYERIISDLFFLSKITVNNSKEQVFYIIQTYLLSDDVDNHNIPQHVFITDDNKELIPNIHVLRTETLTTDMHKLGYTDFNYHEHANKEKVDYYDYLNNDSIKLINDFYDDDFRLFNYTKNPVF
jgi:hypothetical protein